MADQFSAAERRARSLRRDLTGVKLETAPYDFEAAFRSPAEPRRRRCCPVRTYLCIADKGIAELALQYRLPGMLSCGPMSMPAA